MRLGLGSLLFAAALGACSSPELAQTSGGVEMRESTLDLGLAFLGYPAHRTLSVENTSPADLALTLATAAPFSAPTHLTVSGGQVLAIDVTFEPTAVGAASSTLTVSGAHVHLVASLSGQGVAVPGCAPSGACATEAFDPDAGRCVSTQLADGTDCSSSELCLDHPTCQGGVCQGSAQTCDDHDGCTTDACSATVGCTHAPIACPAPSDPCQAPSCDSSNGCGSQPAPDGTVCGSVDCTTAHICLLGSCEAVPVPDGSECTPATACRGEGTCQGGTCAIPDAGVMVPAWTYSIDGGGEIGFNGTIDGDGNLYWSECVDSCQLVSATTEGYVRYRVPLAGTVELGEPISVGGTAFGLFGSTLAVVTVQGAVEAHDAASGALRWSRGPADFFSDGGSAGAWQISGLVAGAVGELDFVAQQIAYSGPASYGPEFAVLSISLADGHLLRSSLLEGSFGTPIGDGAGTLWLSGIFDTPDGGEGAASVFAWAPDGGALASAALANVQPVAAFDGWLFLNQLDEGLPAGALDGGFIDGQQIVITGSADYYSYGYGYPTVASPVFDGTTGFVFANGPYGACGLVACDPAAGTGATVSGFDPDAGAVSWSLQVPSPDWYGYYDALLTNRATVLVTLAGLPIIEDGDTPQTEPLPLAGSVPALLEISGKGEVLSSCALPTNGEAYEATVGGAALHAGRWFVARYPDGFNSRIEAYDIPGADIAPHGWVCNGGNPAHTARPW